MQLQLTASPRRFLWMLLGLRVLALAGQAVTIAIAWRWLHIALPLHALTAALVALAAIALLSGLRLRAALPVTQLELTVQLLLDMAELSTVLYLSGGTTNPFASLLLIPVALAAAALARRYVAIVMLTALGCYGWLMAHSLPLGLHRGGLMGAFDLHMIGMHVTFLLCTVLLAGALTAMAAEIRRRGQSMSELREAALRREHLSAMGMLAAGAAHGLSTPLFSMAMLVSELREARAIDAQFRADLSLLERQIELCKDRLSTLLSAARDDSRPGTRRTLARRLLQQVLDNWSLVRPGVRLEVDWSTLDPLAELEVDEGFSQALTSLLDNAADASALRGSERVRVTFSPSSRALQISIDDDGAGLDAKARQRAGKAAFSTKPRGFGLGLVLSHANLGRLHGNVTLSNRPEGGTRTTITLPIPEVHYA